MYNQRAHHILLKIMEQRRIVGEKNIKEFLSPLPKSTYDPFLLLGMQEGVDLILDTINKNKKICIYGDYDADGITSTSILMKVFGKLTNNLMYYIPNRFEEGYGLNIEAIKKIKNEKVDLIITVDCGITSVEEVEIAKQLGMDVIITDHHNPLEVLPKCIVIDPKQSNCTYPFKSLAGCGVAFKLVQALKQKNVIDSKLTNECLDILAIGTIGDVMPLIDENRTMVKYGLNKLNSLQNLGVRALAKEVVVPDKLMISEDVSYRIVPNLNATGRMKTAKMGVELFLATNYEQAVRVAKDISRLNIERKNIQEKLYQKALYKHQEKYKNKKFPFILLENAHEGIIGIVAGKLKETLKKPISIITENGDNYKGTVRSTENVDAHKLLLGCSELFEKFGGHKKACGFTVSKDNLPKLIDYVDDKLESKSLEEIKDPIKYDMVLDIDDVSIELYDELEKLEPFGESNLRPKFKFENIQINNYVFMGNEANHAKITTKNSIGKIDILRFNISELEKSKIISMENMDFIGTLNLNKWQGNVKIQIIIDEFCE